MTSTSPSPEGCLIALTSLPGVGPARLRALVDAWGAVEAWRRVGDGTACSHPSVARSLGAKGASSAASWKASAAHLDPAQLLEAHQRAGVDLVARGTPCYPESLQHDPAPPELLYLRGNASLLGHTSVAIVGTRRCTRYGHDVARRLGHELAETGIDVVSGLALGIDGAAHRGVLETTGTGSAIGVVGSGLDVVYPARNRELWAQVETRGLLVSETPLGVAPDTWRFPARNRIIAGLADVVVVVESAHVGGSLLTVDEAARRGRDVLAVPGPITAPASSGTNRLIADGARPVLDTADVLDALGISSAPHVPPTPGVSDPDEARVLDELTDGPHTLDELATATGYSLDRLALVVTVLEMHGAVARSGGYLEKVHVH